MFRCPSGGKYYDFRRTGFEKMGIGLEAASVTIPTLMGFGG